MDEIAPRAGPAGAAGRPEDHIDWAQVRLLFATNWRVWFNRISQRRATLIATAIFLVMFGVLAIGGSVAIGAGIRWLRATQPDVAAGAVHLVFLGVFFLLVITPVLGFRGNEFLDVTKLFVYPVSHRTVFAATLGGLLGSGAVLFFSVPLIAAVIGYGGSIDEVIAGLIATLLLLVVAVALGQFLLLAFLDTFKSRKWRDLSMILVPLVFGGLYVSFQVLAQSGARDRSQFLGVVEWFSAWKDWTLPLPSWWAAHAVTGDGAVRLLPVLALAALLAWLVHASAVLQERTYYGEVRDDAPVAGVQRRGFIARVASRLPDPLGALVEKEVAILGREPAVRSILIGQAMYPVIWGGVGIVSLTRAPDVGALAKYVPLAGLIAYPLLLMELGLFINLLGLEGGGAVHAMLLPVKRRLLLLGKDAAYLMVFGTINAIVAVAATIAGFVLTHSGTPAAWVGYCLLGAIEGYCVAAVGLALGNVVSVVLPIRVAVGDRPALAQQVRGRDVCMRSLLGLVGVFGSLLLSLPVAAGFHLPYVLGVIPGWAAPPGWVILVTAPFAVAIAFGLMYAGAIIGGGLLQAREEDVVARLAKSDD